MAKPTRQRYAVGIDLGTSNCALAYADLREKAGPIRFLDIPQWSAADRIETSTLLPSFAYYPPESLPAAGSPAGAGSPAVTESPVGTESQVDWEDRRVVGLRAREAAAREPGRVIASAKSWLAHAGVDRRARILPWGSREIPEEDKLSPVEASALYLAYLKAVWDRAMAGEDGRGALERQHVTLTVPAAFDQAARRLTLEAAKLAGYPSRLRLLEEPQAAFHAWLDRHPEPGALREALGAATEPVPETAPRAGPGEATEAAPRRVLVCDMGGGTTDFSLFSVAVRADGGAQIRREAVGDHILLGGDNIDLALARLLEARAGGDPLDPSAWQRLVAEARALKERVLAEAPSPEGEAVFASPGPAAETATTAGGRIYRVGIAGSGSAGGLFAATRTAEVTGAEIGAIIDGGFFPDADAGDRPRSAGGLRELGLPYAADTAVTRHLARFLAAGATGPVDAVLCNGGALTPTRLQERLRRLIGRWQGRPPRILENPQLDLAVARGAACHGRDLALGLRPRISGGAGRSLYLEATAPTAPAAASPPSGGQYLVCILPLGAEVEEERIIDGLDLRLTVNQPVEFRLYEAARRPGDRAGNLVRYPPEEFRELPPLRTVARLDAARAAALGGAETPVSLHVRLDAMGLLEVSLVSAHKRLQPPERWGLQFEMRALRSEGGAGSPDGGEGCGGASAPEEPMPPDIRARAAALLASPFEPGVLRRLEDILGRRKTAWPRTWLRQLWDPLREGLFHRDRGAAYEAAWLNAAGFLLRPGFGMVLDDHRMDQVWQAHVLGPSHPRDKAVRDQYCLLWRRVAGGLSPERQAAVFAEAMSLLSNPAKPADEAAAMAAAQERVPVPDKEQLLGILLQSAELRRGSPLAPLLAALGRLLSRVLLHAGDESVLPPDAVEKAFARFRTWDWSDPRHSSLAVVFSQAARLTGHRALDVSGSLRSAITEKLRESGAKPRLVQPVEEYLPVQRQDLDQLYGEPLPLGLALGRFS